MRVLYIPVHSGLVFWLKPRRQRDPTHTDRTILG
jgi:hypothetical protein